MVIKGLRCLLLYLQFFPCCLFLVNSPSASTLNTPSPSQSASPPRDLTLHLTCEPYLNPLGTGVPKAQRRLTSTVSWAAGPRPDHSGRQTGASRPEELRSQVPGALGKPTQTFPGGM